MPREARIRLGGKARSAKFYRAETLTTGTIVGPAVIEEATSTCFVPEGWSAHLQQSGGVLLERTTP